MPRKFDSILQFEIIPQGCESDLIRMMNEYRSAVDIAVREIEEIGSRKIIGTKMIPSALIANCKTCAIMDAKKIVCKREKLFKDMNAVSSLKTRKKLQKEIDELRADPGMVCVWKTNVKTNIHDQIVSLSCKTESGKQYLATAQIIVPENKKEELSRISAKRLNVSYHNEKFYLCIEYYGDKAAEPVKKDLVLTNMRLNDAEKADIAFRSAKINLYGNRVIGRLISRLSTYPIVVVKTKNLQEYIADNAESAECIELLMARMGISYERNDLTFRLPFSQVHMDTLIRFYVSDPEHMKDLTNKANGKLCSVYRSTEEKEFVDLAKTAMYTMYPREIIFVPFILEEAEEKISITTSSQRQCDKLGEILSDNNISYDKDNFTFCVGFTRESFTKLVDNIYPDEPRKNVTTKQIDDYIREKYGRPAGNAYIAEMKRRCGIKFKLNSESTIKITERKKEMILDAFRHFGMIE